MNALEEYYKKLDDGNYDYRDALTINSEFQGVIKQLFEEGKKDVAYIADIDRQVFSIQKSLDKKTEAEKGVLNGLGPQMSGTQTLEDGSQAPLYWPDISKLTPSDFEYIEARYKVCKNLYAKTEYGLTVYLGGKTVYSKHSDFKKQLCKDFFQLSDLYLKKADAGGEKNYYSLYFFKALKIAFGIAEQTKLEPELTDIIKYVFNTHQNWDIKKDGTLRILLDLSGIMSEYYGLFSKFIDFQKVLDKNILGANELENTYVWGAMYTIDRNIAIEQKKNVSPNNSLNYKAKLYEKLALEAESRSNLACVNFSEHALRIYQQLNDSVNSKRLEDLYSKLRGKFRLSDVRQELPAEHVDDLEKRILKTVSESDEKTILQHFIISPWYDKIDNIKTQSIELRKKSVFLSMLPTSILDKFGNTVDVFHTDEEKEKFSFWNYYSFNFQIGTQTMHRFFMEAYKSGKLSYTSTISYLETTWYNEAIKRKYHGQDVDVKPIDILKPSLKKIFDELDLHFADTGYRCDFVTMTDSLVLKIEGLLRYFCEKTGIATFKTRQKGSDKVVMEKLLDDLLVDIAHKPTYNPKQETNFDEEDRIYIKYVMTEKSGLNLRNLVAHSLMDVYEYNFERVVVLFCMVLKLSKYKFIETKGDKDENSSK